VQGYGGHGDLDAMIARHAAAEGVPEALVHRVVVRESRYHPRVVGAGGAMGLMQIKYSTARAMGYRGSPAGLLDPDTNLTYAVRYLAGAYRVAHGSYNRAVMNYARGYYGGAKREGLSPYRANAWSRSYASVRPLEGVVQNAASGFDRQVAGR
jgi:soluble lytic murein transglycosylase-like protein